MTLSMTFPGARALYGLGGLLAAAILAAGFTATPAFAAKDPIYTGLFSNLAVDGHDPVAYFTDGAPTRGSAEFSYDWRGAQWRFASAENRQRFIDDPQAYAPQYGGYCAWAVSQGYTAKGDPDHWRIVDGRLYLNYNGRVQGIWETDIPGFIALADENWPSVLED